MKIENNVRSINAGNVSESAAKGARTGPARGSAPQGGGERVEFSPLSSQLSNIEASLANVPVVDIQRVDEIKQAISEGRFKVNPEVIADRLLQTVTDLIRSHRN